MIKGVDFSKVKVVVELGPGNGCITEEILRQIKPKTKVLLVEIEQTFAELLLKRFGENVILEQSDAAELASILNKHNIRKVDLLISGLPFLPEKPKRKLFASISELTHEGTIFRFLTYMPPIMKRVYRDLPVERQAFSCRNIPPIWVFGIN